MDDLISRQAAIEAFDGEISVTGRANAEAVRGYVNLVRDRIKRLPAADVRPVRWIRTSERMPEEGGKYLCVWQGKSIDTGYFFNGHFRLYGEIKDHLVSHWMPLPELPHCGADMRGRQE